MTDQQFEFPVEGEWRQKGKSQKVRGTSLEKYSPYHPIENPPRIVEYYFEKLKGVWAFGPNTRFVVRGQFQGMTPSKDGDPPNPWESLSSSECEQVIVAPNWLESLIVSFTISIGNKLIRSSKEEKYVTPFLNAWKYNFMDVDQKKRLCPQDCSTGYGVPSKTGNEGWSFEEGSEWRQYGPKIFGNKRIDFDWTPLDVPPFFQGTNYLQEQPKICPMANLDKITVRIHFHEHPDSIFQNKAGNEKKYRFYFRDLYFVAEELYLDKTFQKSLLGAKKGEMRYQGVTRHQVSLKVPGGSTSHKGTFEKVFFPEGIFIFAIPNEVLDGNYTYARNPDGNVFSQHNIEKITFAFDGDLFFLEEPNIGNVNNDLMEKRQYNEYLNGAAPFGLKVDKSKITLHSLKEGAKNSPYPHVHVNFCNFGGKSRIIPKVRDGSILQERHDLDYTLFFNRNLAPNGVTFITYIYYTDCNLIYDQKSCIFKSDYLSPVIF